MNTSATTADTLFGGLKQIISGNLVSADEIIETGRQIEQYPVTLEVAWTFKPITTEQHHPGNPGVDSYRHFGRDANEYAKILAELQEDAADNPSYRTEFLSGLLTLGPKGLPRAQLDRFEVKHLGALSVHHDCGVCNAQGKVTCTGCSGNGTWRCPDCNGTGTKYTYESVPYTDSYGNSQVRNEYVGRACYTCRFGRINCRECAGSGKVVCQPCGGNAFLTRVANVVLYALPQCTVSLGDERKHEALFDYLQTLEYASYPERMQHQGEQLWATGNALTHGRIAYAFSATVTQLELNIKKQGFTFQAIGQQSLRLINHPSVFDFLFSDIFREWKRLSSNGGKRVIDMAGSKRLFDKLRSAPIPTRIMTALSKGQKHETLVTEIRHGTYEMISRDCASGLVKVQQQILEILSPRYSENAWSWAMLVPWLFIFVLVHFGAVDIRNTGEFAILGGIAALLVLILTVVMSLVAHPLSVIACRRLQKGVPEEFRRAQTYKEPLFRYGKAGLMVWLCAVTTAVIFRYLEIDLIARPVEALITMLTSA